MSEVNLVNEIEAVKVKLEEKKVELRARLAALETERAQIKAILGRVRKPKAKAEKP